MVVVVLVVDVLVVVVVDVLVLVVVELVEVEVLVVDELVDGGCVVELVLVVLLDGGTAGAQAAAHRQTTTITSVWRVFMTLPLRASSPNVPSDRDGISGRSGGPHGRAPDSGALSRLNCYPLYPTARIG